MKLQLLFSAASLFTPLSGVFSEEPSSVVAKSLRGVDGAVDTVSDKDRDERPSGRGGGIKLRGSSTSSQTVNVNVIFDFDHRAFTGELAQMFNVQWADGSGRLGSATVVERRSIDRISNHQVTFSGVSSNTPGFRLRALDRRGALFVDQMRAEANGRVLNGLSFERNNFDGYCLSRQTSGRFFFGRCFQDRAYECLDFCTGGQVRVVQNCGSSRSECPIMTPPPTTSPTPKPTNQLTANPTEQSNPPPSKQPTPKPTEQPTPKPTPEMKDLNDPRIKERRVGHQA